MKKYKKRIAKVLCLLFLIMLLLSTIVLGESTVEKIENGKLYSLRTMAEVYKTPPGVTIVDSMYSGAVSAPNLKHIIISKGVTEIGSFFFYGVTCNLRNLESIEMADTVRN
jgi:hypothetical protein